MAAGLALLLAYCIVEAANNPGYSLVDAYWRGRLPWMGIAEGVIVVGATASAVVGAVATWAGGGWLRRAATIPPLMAVAFWWVLALMPPRQAVPCDDCPARPLDPWAYAYSLPETAALLLFLPALLIVALALIGTGRRTRSAVPGYISPS